MMTAVPGGGWVVTDNEVQRVVRREIAELPRPAQEFLRARTGVRIDRVRAVDGRVLAFIRSYVPVTRCPGLAEADLENRSLYQVLAEDHGLRVGGGRRTVEAVAAGGEIAEQLGIEEGEPLLLLRSASLDEQGEPLVWSEEWHHGDRSRFEIEVVAGEPEQPVGSVVRPRPQVTDRTEPTDLAGGSRAREVSEALRRSRVLAVLRADSYGDAAGTARALAAHGFHVIEVTINGEASLAALQEISNVPGVLVGAGTVTTGEAARAALAAGARFLVAPLGAQAVTDAAGTTPVLLIGYTLHEVYAAGQATATPVMVFPASAGGPGYMSTLVGQVPDVPLLPAGGVNLDNAVDYLTSGALAVAIGQSLCPTEALPGPDLAEISARAERLARSLPVRS